MNRAQAIAGTRGLAAWAGTALLLLAVSGCRHRQAVTQLPPEAAPPPPVVATAPERFPPAPAARPSARIPVTPVPPGGLTSEDIDFVAMHEPIYSEAGDATWYTAPYKGRKAANGQPFDDHAFTAAQRTLPLGSLISVTNLKTGQSAIMRVNDRGPFVHGRVIDLTIASAKATGIYASGTAPVRIDVYQTPKPIDSGGRWCVQIGAFTSEHRALRLKEQLLSDYPGSRVIEFPGEDAWWVRIRPQGDNREQAEYIARHIRPAEGEAFLTRLD